MSGGGASKGGGIRRRVVVVSVLPPLLHRRLRPLPPLSLPLPSRRLPLHSNTSPTSPTRLISPHHILSFSPSSPFVPSIFSTLPLRPFSHPLPLPSTVPPSRASHRMPHPSPNSRLPFRPSLNSLFLVHLAQHLYLPARLAFPPLSQLSATRIPPPFSSSSRRSAVDPPPFPSIRFSPRFALLSPRPRSYSSSFALSFTKTSLCTTRAAEKRGRENEGTARVAEA